MAELNVPIYDFRFGVLTPKLKDRPNLDLYKSGVLVGENFLTLLHGPTEFRPGLEYSRTTRRNNVAHFIPFSFSDSEAYMLSFTDGYMRLFTDAGLGATPGVLMEDALNITGITQANPGVLTVPGHTFINGDEVFVEDVEGMTDLNGQFYLVTGSSVSGISEWNWPFTSAVNYTYNPTLIDVAGGVASLNPQGGTTVFDFLTPSEYNAFAGAEVSGGAAHLTWNILGYDSHHPYVQNSTGFVYGAAFTGVIEAADKPIDWLYGQTEIKYQLSDDDGATWQWWSGAAWAAITGAQTNDWYYANETNAVAILDTNIAAFTAAGTLKFRAFLHSPAAPLADYGTLTPRLLNLEFENPAYSLADPTIETNTGFAFSSALQDFTEIATKPGTTAIQYIVSIDDGLSYLYWSGAAWVASNGTYAQSNSAATVDTNIATLGGAGIFKFIAFLHTGSAVETPILSNVHTQFTVGGTATFSLTDQDGAPIDTSGFDAYTAGGLVARVYEIESPFLEADLPQLKFAQKADIMYIDHPDYAPRKLTRFGSGTWTITSYNRVSDPFEQADITNISQNNPGQVTTAADHGFSNGDSVLIEDVSGMIGVNHTLLTVTVIDTTNFTIGVDTSLFDAYTAGGVAIREGVPPATVGFYGGRVFHGGSVNDPDLMFGSKSPDPTNGATRYEDFTVGPVVDDAIAHALTSASTSSVDRIRFFMGTRQFLATGTYAGMLKVNGGSDSIPISALAIQSYPVDNYGVADIMPINFGTSIIYVQRGGEVVYSFRYTLLSDGWKSEDETLQSDEITLSGVKQLAYQQGFPNQVWCAMNDGRLLSFVFSEGEGTTAWNEHLIGAGGKAITVGAQPQEDNIDRVWVVVERVVNGVTRRYVEYLAKSPRIPERTDFYSGIDAAAKAVDDSIFRNKMFYAQRRQVHLDSSLALNTAQTNSIQPAATTGDNVAFTASGDMFSATDLERRIQVVYNDGTEQGLAIIIEYVSASRVNCKIINDFANTDPIFGGNWYFTQDTIEGLGHLEGETVGIVADGGVHPDRVVVNGVVGLEGQTAYAMVGLRYVGRVKTMPLELLLSTGITPGKFKSVNKVNLMFRNALGVSYGTDPYSLEQIGFRTGVQFTDRPPLLFSGVKERPGFDNFDEQRSMWVIQTLPYPCTLNAMVMDMEFSEEN